MPQSLSQLYGHLVHLLYRVSKNKIPSKVVGEIKSQSSKWLKEKFPGLRSFAWQGGYALFSVSASQVVHVNEYIAKQAEHHTKMTFQEEFRRLLEGCGIEYDERYVWD